MINQQSRTRWHAGGHSEGSGSYIASVNKVILIGNLGRDAELRYTPHGTPVATINLATTEVWNDKQGKRQERTEWHRVVIWGKPAENLAEHLVKGKQVYIEGKLQTRKWADKDGVQRYTTEIRSDRVMLVGHKGEAPQAAEPQDDAMEALVTVPPDEDIPF